MLSKNNGIIIFLDNLFFLQKFHKLSSKKGFDVILQGIYKKRKQKLCL